MNSQNKLNLNCGNNSKQYIYKKIINQHQVDIGYKKILDQI